MLESLKIAETKDKEKRKSKGVRTHIRRLKQAKRLETILEVPKKKKVTPL